jgi:Uncharacterized metal-binding protein
VPSGKVHTRASLVLTASGFPVALWTCDPLAGLACAAGSASGVVLSPDLDVDHKTESEEVVWRWGCVFGIAFMTYWLPYGLVMPHRSFWSHFPVVSTSIRVVYGFWWLVPLSFAIRLTPGPLFWWYFAWWFAGLCLSDAAHWMMDKLSKKRKG